MGRCETPARAQAVILPPRPDARGPESEPAAAEAPAPGEGPPPQCSELAVPSVASAPSPSALPAVEPRGRPSGSPPSPSGSPPSPSGSPPSPSVPPLPVAALERPTALRAELTPSPVPRVSLVPPTGRIDSSHLAELSGLESRQLPTVAPRATRMPSLTALPEPSLTIPLLPKRRARVRGLARRLANDVRSSKREIALGLVIGIVLSFVLGKVGQRYLERRYLEQRYLESRERAPALVTQSFANEPAPAVLHRAGSGSQPALSSSQQLPGLAGAAASPAARGQRAPELEPGTPHVAAPARSQAPAPRATPRRAPAPPAVAPGRGPRQAPAGGNAAAQALPEPGKARGAPAAAAPPSSPAEPLSPAERAGLGLELPL